MQRARCFASGAGWSAGAWNGWLRCSRCSCSGCALQWRTSTCSASFSADLCQGIHGGERGGILTSDDTLLVYEQSQPVRAYPLRLLGYHHLVEDEAGGTRLLATYDPFSRSAIIGSPRLDDQPLQFSLVGMENQNFLMRDEQTGSWWRQATGEAIGGSLRATSSDRCRLVLTLEILQREHPDAEVLKPADGSVLLPSDPVAPRANLPAPQAEGPYGPLDLVVGVMGNGAEGVSSR
ncbi:MAG: DUF3179 domain-containing (seleno)protein [Bryobacterales bacterium]